MWVPGSIKCLSLIHIKHRHQWSQFFSTIIIGNYRKKKRGWPMRTRDRIPSYQWEELVIAVLVMLLVIVAVTFWIITAGCQKPYSQRRISALHIRTFPYIQLYLLSVALNYRSNNWLANLIIISIGTNKMTDLLMGLVLVGTSVVMVTVSGAFAWCWLNRKRQRFRKFCRRPQSRL